VQCLQVEPARNCTERSGCSCGDGCGRKHRANGDPGTALSIQLRQHVSKLWGRGTILSWERLRTLAVEALSKRHAREIRRDEQYCVRHHICHTAVCAELSIDFRNLSWDRGEHGDGDVESQVSKSAKGGAPLACLGFRHGPPATKVALVRVSSKE
jgi:hypothetical protein